MSSHMPPSGQTSAVVRPSRARNKIPICGVCKQREKGREERNVSNVDTPKSDYRQTELLPTNSCLLVERKLYITVDVIRGNKKIEPPKQTIQLIKRISTRTQSTSKQENTHFLGN